VNRRQFIAAAVAIPAVAKALIDAPAVDVTQIPNTTFVASGQQFEVIFPDGSVWGFSGYITSRSREHMSVHPISPMVFSSRLPEPEPEPARPPTYSTMISVNGAPLAELRDIIPPSLDRCDGDELVGLRKVSDLTFCGRFE